MVIYKYEFNMKLIRLLVLLIFILTALAALSVLASPVSMYLGHWSYHFIERFQAKGILGDFLSSIKPYSRDEMAEMINHISSLFESGDINLSKVEKDQLEMLKREFASELADLGISGVSEYDHLLDWSGDGKKLVTEVAYTYDRTEKRGTEDRTSFAHTVQVVIRGDLAGGLFFYSDTKASLEYSDEPLPPYTIINRQFGNYWWPTLSNTYMIFRLPWADLQVGKDEVLWGTGYHGVIGLSGVNPTFDIVKLPFRIWKVKFASILGFLKEDRRTRKLHVGGIKKYLSAHRVEITPFPGFTLGWQEVYIYAENLHIQLINPFMPYQMAEDYFGDTGNPTMEGDIDICLLPNTRIYMSLFMDDFHPEANFFTYGANRWAVSGGALMVDPFGLENIDIRAEYARIEPWLYPHKGIIQDPPIPTSYTHFNTPLGHWIGPNADDLFFEINHRLSANLLTTLSYNRIRKGEIGGSIYDYSKTAMGEDKRFLAGIVEKEKTISLGLRYDIFRDSPIRIRYIHTTVENKQKWEAKLAGTDDRKQPWEAGWDWSQNILEASITLRY